MAGVVATVTGAADVGIRVPLAAVAGAVAALTYRGHANPGITQTLYQHVTPTLSEDQAAKLTTLVLSCQAPVPA